MSDDPFVCVAICFAGEQQSFRTRHFRAALVACKSDTCIMTMLQGQIAISLGRVSPACAVQVVQAFALSSGMDECEANEREAKHGASALSKRSI